MVDNMRTTGEKQGSQRYFTSSDLNEKSVDADEFITLLSVQGTTVQGYKAGYGPDNRNGDASFGDLDLQDDTGSPVDGKFRWALYKDPEQERLIAKGDEFQASVLRDDVSAAKTDKSMFPQQSPGAGNDSVLAFEFKAEPDNDGDTISRSESGHQLGIPYSEIET